MTATKEWIARARQVNPGLDACLRIHEAGRWTYEEALEEAVVALVERTAALEELAGVRIRTTPPAPVLVRLDGVDTTGIRRRRSSGPPGERKAKR